jgi:lipopolysaccharide export system protein LptC
MNTARCGARAGPAGAWLPALLMMLFALGTWWLVRSAPELPGRRASGPPSARADYFMRDFSVRSFDPTGG